MSSNHCSQALKKSIAKRDKHNIKPNFVFIPADNLCSTAGFLGVYFQPEVQ